MQFVLLVLALASTVYSHGIITSPPPRMPGAAMKAACGEQGDFKHPHIQNYHINHSKVFDNQSSDNEGNIQGELQIAMQQKDHKPATCELSLCKGYQFADNSANIQTFTPGQVLPMTIKVGAPHTGTANVSIVDTKANAIIGDQLIFFSDYASTSHTIPANNTQFSVTIPDLGSKCAVAGDCVLQWWWNAPEPKQTYESCVDFTMNGSGAASPAAPAGTSSASAPAASDDCPPVSAGK
jgi:hypothetical protein